MSEIHVRNALAREARIEDLPAIRALDPERADDLTPGPDTLNNIIVLTDDMVIAYGAIKIVGELVIATNKSVSPIMRAHSIKRMMSLAKEACASRPLKELVTFTNDERYSEFLTGQLGFEIIKEIPLSYNLR